MIFNSFRLSSIALLCFTFLFATTPAQSQPKSFNLIEAEMDGRPVCRYPMDSLTTYIGRPSAVMDKEIIASEVGPKIHYHKKGLSFHLLPERQDESQGVYTVGIRLIEKVDTENRSKFLPYKGRITNNPSKDWKISDVKKSFSEYGITESTPKEKKEEIEGMNLGMGEGELPHTVTVHFDSHRVGFVHEGTTKFLERINLVCEPGLKK